MKLLSTSRQKIVTFWSVVRAWLEGFNGKTFFNDHLKPALVGRYVWLGLILLTVSLLIWQLSSPIEFPQGEVVEIKTGQTLEDTAQLLQAEEVIRSPFWFRLFVIIYDSERSLIAGDYYFNEPLPVWRVAERISSGQYGRDPVRITVFEGWNVFQTAVALERKLEGITAEEVVKLAREGRLFPDTYFFRPNITAQEAVRQMTDNFYTRTAELSARAEATDRDFEEILIMASILQTEANTMQSMRKIADILYRRLEVEMPLQVDVTFAYVNGKNSYELTLEELRTDHPYNTYTRTGLPPTPIANPGLMAIEAALDPIENNYWYFLSDLSGNMYYARNFDEHQYNRANFLRRR